MSFAVSPSLSISLRQSVPDVWPVLIPEEEKSTQGHVLEKQSGPLQGQPPPSTRLSEYEFPALSHGLYQ